MRQLTFYRYATYGLLLLNVAVLVFFFLNRPPGPGGRANGAMRDKMVELLEMDEAQEQQFIQLASGHNERMRDFRGQQQQLLRSYFATLTEPVEGRDRNNLLDEHQRLEREKLEFTYQHFEEVKALLRPAQLSRYETFVRGVTREILGKN